MTASLRMFAPAILLTATVAIAAAPTDIPAPVAKVAKGAITRDTLRAPIRILASDEFEGRGPATRGDAPRRGKGASLLSPREAEAHRESRRISGAIVVLVGLTFLLLNIVVYNTVRTRLVSERWNQLVASTEEKRLDIRDMLAELRHEARFVAFGEKLLSALRAQFGGHVEPSR